MNDGEKEETVLLGLSTMLLPIGFWTVASYLMYLAFSLSLLPGPVLFCALFVMATLIAFPSCLSIDVGLESAIFQLH